MRELCDRGDRGCIRKPIFKLHHNCATAIPQCELGIVDVWSAIRKQLPADCPETGFEEIGARVATRWKRFLEARFLARNNFRNACRELAMREGGKGA